jgi:hypothetical protein
VTVSVGVAASTSAEFAALASEGAPEMNVTASSAARVFAAFGVAFGDCGSVDSAVLLEAAEAARAVAAGAPMEAVLSIDGPVYMNRLSWMVEMLIDIATVADRLGRRVSWG